MEIVAKGDEPKAELNQRVHRLVIKRLVLITLLNPKKRGGRKIDPFGTREQVGVKITMFVMSTRIRKIEW